MKIFSQKTIQSFYSMKNCITDIESMYHKHDKSEFITPVRTKINISNDNFILFMPSYIKYNNLFGIKIYSSYSNHTYKHMPSIQGVTVLVDTLTGKPISLMDSNYLTALRTGALSGIASKYLSRDDSEICTILGCGAQSLEQINAILSVRNIKTLLLYNRTAEKARSLKKIIEYNYTSKLLSVEVIKDPNYAVNISDIVVCVTRSNKPLFDGSVLKEGVHINAIGSSKPHMQEIDVKTLLSSDIIVVDDKESVLKESGDFLIPIKKNQWNKQNIKGELQDIILNRIPSRESAKEITLFKSVGIAYLDILIAKSVYQKGIRMNAGKDIEIT